METKEVAEGFALNFLFPRGLAEVATKDTLKKFEAMRAKIEGERAMHKELLEKALADLDKKVILVGQGKKFEIWGQESWEAKREDWLAESGSIDAIPDELEGLSL